MEQRGAMETVLGSTMSAYQVFFLAVQDSSTTYIVGPSVGPLESTDNFNTTMTTMTTITTITTMTTMAIITTITTFTTTTTMTAI